MLESDVFIEPCVVYRVYKNMHSSCSIQVDRADVYVFADMIMGGMAKTNKWQRLSKC